MRSVEEKKEQKRKAQKRYYEKNKEYYRKQSLEESKRVRKERNLYKSIIKEVREYVKQLIDLKEEDYLKSVSLIYVEKILKILDKENKE